LVQLLFLNDSLIVPSPVYNTSVYYKWTNLTKFIEIASSQKALVVNTTSNATETILDIPGFGSLLIPFGNTYLIPSESALQAFSLKNCTGQERRILQFHEIQNSTMFASDFSYQSVNLTTSSISARIVNGSVWIQGPFNSVKVVKSDLLVEGGVGHVVDGVLMPFGKCP
jgi:uncharacterized surface protein with fasciclin (FAS1) repeats